MANKILQIDLQNDITPQIGSYDNTGNITPNNWQNESDVYSLGPTNRDGTTPYYWFTPTKEVTDFDLCWEDYQDHEQTTPQYHLEIGDSAGNVVLSVSRANQNYSIGPVGVGNLAYQTWHKMLVEVRKASASSSTVTAYVDGKKIDTGTSDTLLTSAKIALLGHVPDSYYWQNAGQRLRYVTIYDRSYSSKGVNLDGIMTTITGFVHKLKGALSTVAFTGSYNDLSNKPTISTVNNGTLTIQQNGTNVQTFTANASTNKTANIQCVDLSTAQTIGGQKIFITSPRVTRAFPDIALNISDCDVTEAPTEAKFATLYFRDKNNIPLSYIVSQQRTDGTKRMCLRTHRTDNINSYYSIDLDSDGNFYPEQNNAINLGTPALQWNNAYIKSLTINGVACGDILTHNASEFAYDTDVVHKSNNETISGNKTFSNSPTVARQDVGTVGYNIKLGFKRGSEIATTNHSTFRVVDSDNEIISEICTENYADGKVAQILNVRNTNNNSSQIQSSISHLLDKTGEQDWIVPSRDNKTYLGTPANRWADVKTALINGKTPAYDSDVVHIKGSDDIIDSKTFISLYTQSSGPSLWMKNTSFTMGTAPTTNRYSGIWVQDNNGADTAYIVHQANKNNSQNLKFSVSNTDGTTVYQNALTFQGRLDGTFNFYSDNPANLGTPTNKWSKVYSDDVVHTTGDETISGVKTFTSNMVIQGSRKVTCNLDNSFIELDGGTSWGKGGSIVLSGQDRSSYTNSVLIVSKSDTNTDILQYQNGELKPHQNNTSNPSLGTSTNKWKSFNGINPGALSLPTADYTTLDTTNFVLDGSTNNRIFMPYDGWLNIRMISCESYDIRNAMNGISYRVPNASGDVYLAIPVPEDTNMAIFAKCSNIELRAYKCQGNV